MELFYPLFELLAWVFLPWVTVIFTFALLLTLSDWLKTQMENEVTEVATPTGS